MKAQDSKKILWITLFLGTIGLVKDLVPYQQGKDGHWRRLLSEVFSLTQLSLPGDLGKTDLLHVGDSILFVNYQNLAFYFLLLIGGILFLLSKHTETRLIRFCFSIVLLSQGLFLLLSLVMPFFNSGIKKTTATWWLVWAGFLLLRVLYLYIAYWIITTISKSKELKLTVARSDTGDAAYLTEASNIQRFWHWLIDTFIFILIISWLIEISRINFWRSIGRSSTAGYVTLLLFVVSRILYYIIYEAILGATPAKFLTETRVTDHEGSRNKFSTILVRTVSRVIPFEPFSFFWNGKWHDSLSKTFVLKEKRTGYKAVFYLWLIPIFLLTGFGLYYGYRSYQDHQSYRQYKKEFEQKMDGLSVQYQHVSTQHIIVIKADGSYSNEYFKVEEITGASVVVAKIKLNPDTYPGKMETIRKAYQKNIDSLQRREISKDAIAKALTTNFEAYRKNDQHIYTDLFKNGTRYEVVNMIRLYGPVLENKVGAYQQDLPGEKYAIVFDFLNTGEGGRLVDIKNLEGNIQWNESLPRPFSAAGDYRKRFKIEGYNLQHHTPYKFTLLLEDDSSNKYNYLVEGENTSFTLKEIYN